MKIALAVIAVAIIATLAAGYLYIQWLPFTF